MKMKDITKLAPLLSMESKLVKYLVFLSRWSSHCSDLYLLTCSGSGSRVSFCSIVIFHLSVYPKFVHSALESLVSTCPSYSKF